MIVLDHRMCNAAQFNQSKYSTRLSWRIQTFKTWEFVHSAVFCCSARKKSKSYQFPITVEIRNNCKVRYMGMSFTNTSIALEVRTLFYWVAFVIRWKRLRRYCFMKSIRKTQTNISCMGATHTPRETITNNNKKETAQLLISETC